MPKPIRDLEAFCETCPAEADVTAALQMLGFHLEFQMGAIPASCIHGVPALPPQYHYTDDYATEVVYLAGRDVPLEGERYPLHASRFWLWSGAKPEAYQRAASLLANKWHLTWLLSEPDSANQQDIA